MDIMVSQFLSGGYSYSIDNLTLFIATKLLRENSLRWDMKLNKIKGSISWFVQQRQLINRVAQWWSCVPLGSTQLIFSK
jgi:hypothetical protein